MPWQSAAHLLEQLLGAGSVNMCSGCWTVTVQVAHRRDLHELFRHLHIHHLPSRDIPFVELFEIDDTVLVLVKPLQHLRSRMQMEVALRQARPAVQG